MMASRRYAFASDNTACVDTRILAALIECNSGVAPPYGADELSAQINAICSEIFEREVFVFATPTGTAANGLALGSVTPSFGAIFCHEKAHIVTSECGAPEFFSNGARLVLLPGESNKIKPGTLADALTPYRTKNLHQLRPAAVSVTQATEGGTVYDCSELAAISRISRSAGLKMHMDGARFSNALVHLGCSPAEMSWKAGVDILSFGTTKNGTMNAEAVVAFDRETAETLRYLHKRAGFLLSKMRFATAQLRAYVSADLWIENARQANTNAQRLSAALSACEGTTLEGAVQSNQIFVHLSSNLVKALAESGIELRPWPHPRSDMFRIVTSYNDSEELICRFEKALSRSKLAAAPHSNETGSSP